MAALRRRPFRQRQVVQLVVAVAAAGMVACGGNGSSGPGTGPGSSSIPDPSHFIADALSSQAAAAQSAQAHSAATSTAAAVATKAPTATHAAGTAAPTARTSPTPTFPQYAPGSTPAVLTASLSKSCVTPGGTETLTIHAEPDFQVSFDTQYSDGKDGGVYGGKSLGKTNSDGVYSNTWTVSPAAPAGQVIVWVAASKDKETAFRQPTFVVASSC